MFRYVLAAIFIYICSFSAYAQSQQPPTGTEKPTTAVADYSKEGYVIEQLRSTYTFENDGTGKHELYIRVRAQSDAGVEQLGRIIVGYNSANERVEIPYVRVLKKDGSKIVVSTDSAQDVNPFQEREAPVYTDFHQKHLPVSGLSPGDVVEYDIVKITHTALAAGQFWMQHDFDNHSIVLDERLEINIPKGRTVKLKTKPGLDAKVSEENGRKIYRWTHANLESEKIDLKTSAKDRKKKKDKKKMPEQPDIQMTTFSDWDQVGQWYAALERDRRAPTPEIRSKAEELTKGADTPLAKTEALYDYVAKNFRYISLSLGMGRYQPHSAGDVLHNQYGDCKDKNTLLAALLEAEGIHSSSVLINSARKLDPEVPSPSQFDHAITLVSVGEQQLWLDTTTEIAPFQLLSSNLRDKQALVIGATGASRLEKTPPNPPSASSALEEIEGKVNDLGKLDAHVRYVERGDTELILRMIFRKEPRVKWEQLVEMMLAYAGTSGDVSDLKVSDPAATREPFEFSFHLEKANYIDWSKKKVELSLPLASFTLPEGDTDADTEKEAEPLVLGAPGEHTYRLKLELPAKYTASAPLPFSMSREYADFNATYKLAGTVFTAERKMMVRKREVPVDALPGYVAFRRAVSTDSAQKLSLETKGAGTPDLPKDSTADDLNSAGLEALKNGKYELAIQMLKHAVELDPKHKWAWNNLGRAQLDLHHVDEAIAAFQKQIEISPYDEYAYNNLGRAYSFQRNYEKAVAAFRKQLEVNPLDRWAHSNLGGLYLDWHKYDEAAPELEKAVALAPNEASPHLQLGKAYLNLGQEDKALIEFDRALEISATPLIWNDVAYELSLKKTRLDKARQYAESAVASTSASLRNVTLDHVATKDMYLPVSLSAYWDTLGWVYFAQGDLTTAERYISAAWKLDQRSEVGDHLGQIYARRGQSDEAIRTYAIAMNARRPDPETRARLAELLGGEARVASEIDKNRDQLAALRTVRLVGTNGISGKADFLVLLEPDSKGAAVDDVKFISGEEKLKGFDTSLRHADFPTQFPDSTPTKIVRRGTLTCPASSGDCTFVMALPEDVESVD